MAVAARLKVTAELKAAFVAAQGGKQRFILVKVKEEQLVLHEQAARAGSAEEDFDGLVEKLGPSEAAFILFQLDEESKWLFVAFVPDSARVRDKMMYASSIADLQTQLGKEFFSETYKCSEKSELSFRSWTESKRERSNSDVMTAKELMLREEASLDRSSCATGMKAVPFKMKNGLEVALGELRDGARSVVEIRINPKSEQCTVGKLKGDATMADMAQALSKRPCYLVLSGAALGSGGAAAVTTGEGEGVTTGGGKMLFVFYCPEAGVKPMLKMLYATAKKAVMDNCATSGINLGWNIEISSGDALQAAVDHELRDQAAAAASSSTTTHNLAFTKPAARKTRRRRGKRGLIKKKVSPPPAPEM